MPEPRFPWDELMRGSNGGKRKPPEGGTVSPIGGGARRWWKGVSSRTKWILGIIILVIVVIVLSASWLSKFFTDYLWFKEVNYTSVFWKEIVTKVWVFFLFGIVFFVLLYGNIWIARRLTPEYEINEEEGSPVEEALAGFRQRAGKFMNWALLLVSVIIAFFVAWGSTGQWDNVLKFFNATNFGMKDPILSKDIGFYMFRYPFYRYAVDWVFTVLIAIFVITAAVHFLYGTINFSRKEERFAPHVKAHLSILAGIILLLQAWRFRLDMYGLMWSKRGVGGAITGASYTDVHAQLPALWILLVTAVICAILFFINSRLKGWRLPLAGVAVIIVVFVAIAVIYPAIIQTYVVKPKELAREGTYIDYNIQATQDAFKIQNAGDNVNIAVQSFPANTNLDAAGIARNQATINNVRIWDPRVLLTVLQQRQVLRQEYAFDEVDVERYTLANGVYTQILASPRELVYDQLATNAKSWQNQHITYTHGYGIVMSPSSEATPTGDPNLVIKDIPPQSTAGLGLTDNRPEVYFGERTQAYSLVRTTGQEIDYPTGSTSAYVTPYYQGSGGIQISNFWKRLAFSIRFRDVSLLFSGYVTSETRLMFHKNITERINAVAPWLMLDHDPYMVLDSAGKQWWIVDGYTTSKLYPYSSAPPSDSAFSDQFNYIRNSVKVVIDPYNGSLSFYLIDPTDPVAETYGKIFPHLFTDFSQMPADLQKQIRYPEDLFTVQMDQYRSYHMDEPNSFYQKEDQWDASTENYTVSGKPEPVRPYYVIMKIPGGTTEEMALIQPFNPHGKPNMVAWVAAHCDQPNYGKLISFVFPSGQLVNGTQQFEAMVDQEPDISQQISLWNQQGSQVIRGNTLVIPIEQSLLYVEPLYLQATNQAIPQLQRVIVGFGSNVTMQNTLADALNMLFGGAAPTPTPSPTPSPTPTPSQTIQQLVTQANNLYNQAQAALRNGDLAGYQNAINQMGAVLQQLATLAGTGG